MIKALSYLPALWLLVYPLSAREFGYYSPDVSYNPEVPALEDVVGHAWGERVSSVEDIQDYLARLTQATANVVLVPYAESWQGRALSYMIVTSRANMDRLGQIKKGIHQLAFPSRNSSGIEALLEDLPSIVWLLYAVHGNEISSPDAALLTAYHLVAAREDPLVDGILENCVVIIDPLQNPDGRARFVSYLQQTQGRWPDKDSQAAEHNEIWPSGRPNHYLFDMNRDWFARTQPETRGRIETYLEWYPQIVIDFHEMDGDSTYFFGPPAKPFNPDLTDAQFDWLNRLGRNKAKWFDRLQIDYFTREVFDSFYPGYGEDWPMFHGSIGMTCEQASTRGLLFLREDETILSFRQAVKHHFTASLATLELASANRRELLEYFYNYRSSAEAGSGTQSIQEFILTPGSDPNRAAKLASNLVSQGIEVHRAEKPFQNEKAFDYFDSSRRSIEFPKGTFLVPVNQPAGRLVKTLLGQDAPIEEEFLREQERRLERRLEQQFYDLTGWSLPLLYGVECYLSESLSQVQTARVGKELTVQGGIKGARSKLAYLIPWGTHSAVRFLAALHRQGIRVHSSDKPFSIGGVDFPRGSLIVKVRNNPEDLFDRLAKFASECGVNVFSTDRSWVDSGVNFGSDQVRYLKKPGIALAYHEPTSSSSTGATRFLLEQSFSYPVTLIHTYELGGADLSRYNVLILPDDSSERFGYTPLLGVKGISRLKAWVQEGGTLLAIGGASKWLTEGEVKLLETTTEKRPRKIEDPEENESESVDDHQKKSDSEDEELPIPVPGAILRVNLDQDHWMTMGYGDRTNVLVNSNRVFRPLKLDKGQNIAVYSPPEELLLSGFMWEESKELLAGKAYLMHQKIGKGRVIAFAEDPNFRAFTESLTLLFMNGVFFGPSH